MWNKHDHEGTVLDWEGFEAKVAEINGETVEWKQTRHGEQVSEPLYRGQRDAGWHLLTTLDRQRPGMTLNKYLTIMERIQPRIERIAGKKWPGLRKEISGLRRNGLGSIWLFPVKSADTETILSFMVYLRQHGFPSPLLDWTADPYKAAFFAFSGVEAETQKVAIYVFRERVGLGTGCKEECEARTMALGPDIENTSERHLKQEAQYTSCVKKSKPGPSLDCYILTDHEQVINEVDADEAGNPLIVANVVTKYTIPASERRKALATLAQRNIGKRTLFEGTPDDLLEDLWNELVIDSTV